MEKESFEDEEVANYLNENFISIKVDREERPDIDTLYMDFCRVYTGSGGWPLTIIMTPDKLPFFAGTYIPKGKKYNMNGILELLNNVTSNWSINREKIVAFSNELKNEVRKSFEIPSKYTSDKVLDEKTIERVTTELKSAFDSTYGGFSTKPKFPTPHKLLFVLRTYSKTKDTELLEIVEKTLKSMYQGGIFDHIGFGFSRYSVDEKWLVPHFEKMLYDNALLALTYGEAFMATKNPLYKMISEKILAYLVDKLKSPEGGFYCGEDADSEGVEGKFYVWSKNEISNILGEEINDFCKRYDITEKGNFEGTNIPNLINKDLNPLDDETFEVIRKKLYTEREKRIHPHKDTKILTSWNGLTIAAFAYCGRIFENTDYIEIAEKNTDFILNHMIDKNNRLYSRYADGEVANKGFLDDYSHLVNGLLELYQSTFNSKYLIKSNELSTEMLKLFYDDPHGDFFLSGNDSEKLILDVKDIYDNVIPSGNSMAIFNLLRLSALTGNLDLLDITDKFFKSHEGAIADVPSAYLFSLWAYSFNLSEKLEIKICGELNESKEIIKIINSTYNPFITVLLNDKSDELLGFLPKLSNINKIDNKVTIYPCKGFMCMPPITEQNLLIDLLKISEKKIEN